MSETVSHSPTLDRYTTMGELSSNVRRVLNRMLGPIIVVLSLATGYLAITHNPGMISFAVMGAGTIMGLYAWAHGGGGLPLFPMLIVQQLVISGLPIITGHEVLTEYPESYVTAAGLEVFVFCVAATVGWRIGMQAFATGSPLAFALIGVDREGVAGLSKFGFGLAGGATAFLVLQSLDLADLILQMLPSGTYSIVNAGISAASACGFFLLAMILGSGDLKPTARSLFWILVLANCLISASSLLLSSATLVIASVAIGLFWSSGKMPWRYILLTGLVISLLNTGKYGMRARYWHSDNEDRQGLSLGLARMPSFYAEWAQFSLTALSADTAASSGPFTKATKANENQSLFQRLNNLQNLLYVIDAVEREKIPTLDGQTYWIIPPLLIPRIFWPDKPRSHEGQVLLNVHFGRQLLESTFNTYIAWGLLAEAYGNFGAIKGSLFIGVTLGLLFAWMEKYTMRKPLLSTEGFVAFAIFLGMANSFETVASVAVTMIFQSLMPVIIACSPFVARKFVVRPET